MATVFESSEPDSIILKQSGIISVVSKKLITSCSSVFTSAPEKEKENIFRQNSFLFISEKSSSLQKELTFWCSHKGSFTNYVYNGFFDYLLPLRWDLLPCERWQKSDIFGTKYLPTSWGRSMTTWTRRGVRWSKKCLFFSI